MKLTSVILILIVLVVPIYCGGYTSNNGHVFIINPENQRPTTTQSHTQKLMNQETTSPKSSIITYFNGNIYGSSFAVGSHNSMSSNPLVKSDNAKEEIRTKADNNLIESINMNKKRDDEFY